MFSQIKDRKHIEQNFHSVAGVMPQGWDFGVLGGSEKLVWGFAMAPHRLRILVNIASKATAWGIPAIHHPYFSSYK